MSTQYSFDENLEEKEEQKGSEMFSEKRANGMQLPILLALAGCVN